MSQYMHAGLVFFFNTDISLSRFDIFYDGNALGRLTFTIKWLKHV